VLRAWTADHVIHVVPPDFRVGDRHAAQEQLIRAYRNVLHLAQELGVTSVALPVLSSDDYRGDMSADFLQTVAQRVLSLTATTVREVYLVRRLPAEAEPAAPLPPAVAERTDDETRDPRGLPRAGQRARSSPAGAAAQPGGQAPVRRCAAGWRKPLTVPSGAS